MERKGGYKLLKKIKRILCVNFSAITNVIKTNNKTRLLSIKRYDL